MPHRNALHLDPDHNSAIRAEIGERLRVLLSKEQPKAPPRVQHLLDRLNKLDATKGGTKSGDDDTSQQEAASVGSLFHLPLPLARPPCRRWIAG